MLMTQQTSRVWTLGKTNKKNFMPTVNPDSMITGLNNRVYTIIFYCYPITVNIVCCSRSSLKIILDSVECGVFTSNEATTAASLELRQMKWTVWSCSERLVVAPMQNTKAITANQQSVGKRQRQKSTTLSGYRFNWNIFFLLRCTLPLTVTGVCRWCPCWVNKSTLASYFRLYL